MQASFPMIGETRRILHMTLITLLVICAYATALLGTASRWKTTRSAFALELTDPDPHQVGVKFTQFQLRMSFYLPVKGILDYREWHHNAPGISYVSVGAVNPERAGHSTRIRPLALPFWPVSVHLFIYPVVAYYRGPRRRLRRTRKGLCLRCGYNLIGNVSGVCPECGQAVT